MVLGSSLAILILIVAGCMLGGGLAVAIIGLISYRWMNGKSS